MLLTNNRKYSTYVWISVDSRQQEKGFFLFSLFMCVNCCHISIKNTQGNVFVHWKIVKWKIFKLNLWISRSTLIHSQTLQVPHLCQMSGSNFRVDQPIDKWRVVSAHIQIYRPLGVDQKLKITEKLMGKWEQFRLQPCQKSKPGLSGHPRQQSILESLTYKHLLN